MPVRVSDLNKNYVEAKYAVRGEVPTLANQIAEKLQDPEQAKKYNFDKVIFCNIGNPQKLGQIPLTFCREVLSLCMNPELMKTHPELFSAEAIERASSIIGSDRDLAAYGYTDAQGSKYIRGQVARFIEKRDGLEEGSINPCHIFLTDGASVAIKTCLSALSDPDKPEKVGFMIPVPQYPLYSAAITCLGNKIIRYYLDEDKSWAVDMNSVREAYKNETRKGIDVRAIIIINPGNPTGSVLSEDVMMEIINFVAENKLVLLADEVYQVNIYNKALVFRSFQQIATKWMKENPDKEPPRVVSFHSVSKGVYGECGQRGGYLSFIGFGECSEVFRQLLKRLGGEDICANIAGQCVVSTMVAPPTEGTEAFKINKEQQKNTFDSLQRRAKMATDYFNNEELGITCNHVEGALYAFPRIRLPESFIKKALENNEQPDLAYAKRLVQETGLVVVPGSGFLQREGTYHFRTSILPQEADFKTFLETLINFQKKILEEAQ